MASPGIEVSQPCSTVWLHPFVILSCWGSVITYSQADQQIEANKQWWEQRQFWLTALKVWTSVTELNVKTRVGHAPVSHREEHCLSYIFGLLCFFPLVIHHIIVSNCATDWMERLSSERPLDHSHSLQCQHHSVLEIIGMRCVVKYTKNQTTVRPCSNCNENTSAG